MKNYTFKINENEYNVQIEKLDKDSNHARVIVNGVEYDVEVAGRTKPVATKPQLGTVKAAPVAEAAAQTNNKDPFSPKENSLSAVNPHSLSARFSST